MFFKLLTRHQKNHLINAATYFAMAFLILILRPNPSWIFIHCSFACLYLLFACFRLKSYWSGIQIAISLAVLGFYLWYHLSFNPFSIAFFMGSGYFSYSFVQSLKRDARFNKKIRDQAMVQLLQKLANIKSNSKVKGKQHEDDEDDEDDGKGWIH